MKYTNLTSKLIAAPLIIELLNNGLNIYTTVSKIM